MRLRFSFLRKSPLFLRLYKIFSFKHIWKYIDDRSVDVSVFFDFIYVCKYVYFYSQKFILLVYTLFFDFFYIFFYSLLYFWFFYIYFLYSNLFLSLFFSFLCELSIFCIIYFFCVLCVYSVFFKSCVNVNIPLFNQFNKVFMFFNQFFFKLRKFNVFLKWVPIFKRHSYLGLWRVYRQNFMKFA